MGKLFAIALLLVLAGCVSAEKQREIAEAQAVEDDVTCITKWGTTRGTEAYTACRAALMRKPQIARP